MESLKNPDVSEKPDVLEGTGFSPYINTAETTGL
jgi:hypothetical protein